MLTARGAAARWAAAVAACAVAVTAVLAATPAGADVVRDQELWVLGMVHAPQAWNVTRGQGVTVAVIDSGVMPSVSDLAGSVVTGPDLSGVSTPMSNPSWGVHGTWMASLIAGHGHAGGSSGIIGVAPAAKVLSIRVVTDRGDPHFRAYQHESDAEVQQALATAITDATTRGARVISMSLGYGTASLAGPAGAAERPRPRGGRSRLVRQLGGQPGGPARRPGPLLVPGRLSGRARGGCGWPGWAGGRFLQ